jgi:hypothetical protein
MVAIQPGLIYKCRSSGWTRGEILASGFFISFEPTDEDLIILVLDIFFSKEPRHRYFISTKSCRLDFPSVQQQPQNTASAQSFRGTREKLLLSG